MYTYTHICIYTYTCISPALTTPQLLYHCTHHQKFQFFLEKTDSRFIDFAGTKNEFFHGTNDFTVTTTDTNFTGWRRCMGCLNLQVIFRKRATIYRALLREMSFDDKASYESLPLCTISLAYSSSKVVSRKRAL